MPSALEKSLQASADHGSREASTNLADIVFGAVFGEGLQAALAVTLHLRVGLFGRGRYISGCASRAAGLLRPITHLPQTHRTEPVTIWDDVVRRKDTRSGWSLLIGPY